MIGYVVRHPTKSRHCIYKGVLWETPAGARRGGRKRNRKKKVPKYRA